MRESATMVKPAATPVKGEAEVPVVKERWPWFFRDVFGRDMWPWFEGLRFPTFMEDIKVEQLVKDDVLVIRAEAPGIDPATDAEVTVHDGVLTLKIERRQESAEEHETLRRSEFRYGSFERTLSLPKGVHPEAVTASYTDGILEIRVPLPEEAKQPKGTKVPITT